VAAREGSGAARPGGCAPPAKISHPQAIG
jgi:hypothetical protein